ncbi:CpaF family protein [Streptacidiphilus pinicola]|uniref:CpaF family protein n=1 Tax=Streptacidiphilus pinicola TaxID=2219663 RepID=UPI001FB48B34|nr:ATPase, T2SS/T4P/T4SS family [Streptacidiphilus pinicola]
MGFDVLAELRNKVADLLSNRVRDEVMGERDRQQLGWSLVVEVVAAWATDYSARKRPLDAQQETLIKRAVFDDLFRAGRLQPLLDDPNAEDIRIDGSEPVEVVYQDRPTVRLAPIVASDAELVELVNQLARSQGQGERSLSPASPLLRMRLADGSRLTANYLVTPRPQVVIRKHRLRDTRLDQLVGWGSIDTVLAEFLKALVRARKNVFVVGGQGAGKTSLLRAMSREIAPGERIGTLESEYELWLHELPGPGPQVVPFEGREGNGEKDATGRNLGELTLADLFPHLQRMSLRRILVGEVRSVEVLPMLHGMIEGEGGSMCTVHARSARAAIERVATLALEARIGMSVELAYRLITEACQFIVFLRQVDETEIGGQRHRFVAEILEITGLGEGGRPSVQRIFAPKEEGGRREPRAVPQQMPSCIDDLVRVGFQREWLLHPFGTWNHELKTVTQL